MFNGKILINFPKSKDHIYHNACNSVKKGVDRELIVYCWTGRPVFGLGQGLGKEGVIILG